MVDYTKGVWEPQKRAVKQSWADVKWIDANVISWYKGPSRIKNSICDSWADVGLAILTH